MTLLGAYSLVLRHWTRQDDLLVGTDIANRHHLEVEGLIGFFVNQLVLRVSLASNPTVGELLAQVRETTLGAYAHQDVPFDLLVAELQPQRSATVAPFFQTKLVLQNVGAAGLSLPGLTIANEPLERGYPGADLALLIAETAEGLDVNMLYNGEIFSASTIERLGRYWMTVVTAMVGARDRSTQDVCDRLTAMDAREQDTRTQRRAERRRQMFESATPSPPPPPPLAMNS